MANIGYIQVNRFCNNKCHFCSNPSNGESIGLTRGIELIDNFKNRNYHGVIFTGGEPTLSSDLFSWIEHTNNVGLESRVISNGISCSDEEYVKNLKKAGLKLIHFSLYSYIEKIHDFLTNTSGSYKKILKAIQNCLKYGIEVQLNCVINKYNEDHLDKNIKFIAKIFPQINHFVWNNLDPLMMRQTEIALSCLPDFKKAGITLIRAMEYLESLGKTFRVERLPLCFMRGFEFASTETRKIVKQEERLVYFLDERNFINDKGNDFEHDKDERCKECDLDSICAGIYEYKKYYNYVNITAQKLSEKEKNDIINLINK